MELDALGDVRVIDLSTGIAGPVATMFLADFGADVVKIEPPDGDPARSDPGFPTWNRGKRGIVCDLATDDGRARLDALLPGADLLVVGEPAPVDVAALARDHPGLVVLSVPPYHGTPPWYGGKESHGLLAAATGVALRQASWYGGPVEMVTPQLLYIQGVWAATCGLAALIERRASGRGQTVTVSGVHAMMEAGTSSLTLDPSAPPVVANFGPGGPSPAYSRYQCGDGGWMFVAALTPKFQAALVAALDIEDIRDDARLGGGLEGMILPDNRGWVRKRIESVFASAPRAHWLEVLRTADVPAGPLLERSDWLDHPQIAAIGMRAEVDDPERGRVVMPGVPVVLTGSPGAVHGPAPRLGEHDATVRPWEPRPYSPEPGTDAPSTAGPLAGYRVLDLGAILAGPYAGALLAELGASVTKVEPPAGDSFRARGFTFNRGMRGLAIDLRKPPGQAAFYQLAAGADVVIDNYRPGVLETLKITYDHLAAANPEIVTLSLTGFGEGGPMSHLPGFDPILQAAGGMMTAQGGDDEPVFYTIAINDVTSAVLATFAITTALIHRGRTGAGQRIWTSLVGASTVTQSGELTRFAGRPPALTGGRDFAGRAPLRRYYTVADGWVRVDAAYAEVDQDALRAAGLDVPAVRDAAGLDAALAAALATVPRDEAARLLTAARVPAVPARHITELLRDDRLMAAGLVHHHTSADGTPYTTAGRFAAFSRTQRTDTLTPPGIGEHSAEVLRAAGLPESEVAALIEDGVVIQGTAMAVRLMANYR
ncbi:MAG TPA: CoA transferase [Streptosporangiaceae bacterium]